MARYFLNNICLIMAGLIIQGCVASQSKYVHSNTSDSREHLTRTSIDFDYQFKGWKIYVSGLKKSGEFEACTASIKDEHETFVFVKYFPSGAISFGLARPDWAYTTDRKYAVIFRFGDGRATSDDWIAYTDNGLYGSWTPHANSVFNTMRSSSAFRISIDGQHTHVKLSYMPGLLKELKACASQSKSNDQS
ncbi:MAG: hypothetical protein OQK24_07705 [Magnetovibrio sp.]|nr:hypothetical protein [Magnetovibrio sp.]